MDALSWLPNYGNKKTTHYYNYLMETMSEFLSINELPKSTFTTTFNKMDQYQWKDPCKMDKLTGDK